MNTKKNSIAGYQHITHTFGPVFDADSEILILGSLPSVQSRAQQFYYGHPQNRFWKVLAAVYQNPVPVSIEEKKAFLQKNHVALWDVIASCDIVGSSDSSIKNVKENDINVILKSAAIKVIYLNGGKAYELFIKYCKGTLQNMDLLESAEPMTMRSKKNTGKCSMEFGAAGTYMGCRNFSCRYCASGKMELLVSLENREKIL